MVIKNSLINIVNVLAWPLVKFNEACDRALQRSIKNRERKEKEEKSYMMIEYHKEILSLDRFPGSLVEYDSMKGDEHEIVDFGNPEKEVTLRDYLSKYGNRYCSGIDNIREWGLFYKELSDKDICGFIYWSGWRKEFWNSEITEYFYGRGVPIRKKSQNQQP